MKINQIMSTPAVTVRRDEPIKDVIRTMSAKGFSALPVVDTDGHIVGILTEGDVLTRAAYGGEPHGRLGQVLGWMEGRDPVWAMKSEGLFANDVMTLTVLTASPGDDIRATARRMLEGRVKRLPVVDSSGRVVGLVARADILRTYCRPDIEIQAEIEDIMASVRRVPEDADVQVRVDRGVVSLTGTVGRPSDRELVEHVAAAVAGVIEVRVDVVAREPEPTLG